MRRTRTRPRWARPERLAAAGALCLLAVLMCLSQLACPAFAAEPSPAAQEPAQSASGEPAEEGGGLSTGAAVTGTAVLVGAGAYTFVRKKWNEEKEKPREFVHYENHTREGTLTPEERRDLID